MSRLLVTALFMMPYSVAAQPMTDAQIAAQIEKARRLVAVDDEGCVKYPVGDEIVVCGTSEENKRNKLDRGPVDENRIRRGEAVSTVRAACCSPIPKLKPLVTTAFGYVPPVALDYEELMKGLPEPDMIVLE